MKTIFAVIGVLTVLFVLAMFAVCNDDEGSNSYARIQVASHGYRDCDPDWDDCGYDQGGDYGDGSYGQGRNSGGGGGNGNRGRRGDNQRGDKNCHSFCGNTIVIPTPPGMGGDQPPPEGQP